MCGGCVVGQVERVLKCLYLKRLYLWPRYHVAVKEWLSQHQPEVEEITQGLTPGEEGEVGR
jgi:DNA excision repair protein ERCC-4